MPVHLIYGEEKLLCDEYLHSLLPDDDLLISRFDMREHSIGEAIAETAQGSLFSEGPKTIILKDCYFLDSEKALSESDQKQLLEVLSTDEENTFIFCVDKIDKRKKLTKELVKQATTFEGKPNLYPTKWLLNRAKEKYQLKLTKAAADKMVASLGTSLYLLDSELLKVKTRYIQEAEVNEAMLSDVLSKTLESNVFKLIELIMEKNPDAFEVLQDILMTESEEIGINLLLARQLRIMEQVLISKEMKTPNPMKLHPYVLQKAQEQAEHYSLAEIQSKLAQVTELDLLMKRGKVAKTVALEKLILEWL